MNSSFDTLQQWLHKPALFQKPVVDHIWNDPWIAEKMLQLQIDGKNNPLSRTKQKRIPWLLLPKDY